MKKITNEHMLQILIGSMGQGSFQWAGQAMICHADVLGYEELILSNPDWEDIFFENNPMTAYLKFTKAYI